MTLIYFDVFIDRVNMARNSNKNTVITGGKIDK